MTTAPYGSWPTRFTSASVVAGAVRLGELILDGSDVLWSEGRPAEGGCTQLVRRSSDGSCTDLLPAGYNARTAVHEYGGGAWWAHAGVVWFANWADQRLYRLASCAEPVPLTPEPPMPRADRFADGDLVPDGGSFVCVRERHRGPSAAEVDNEIVRLDANAPSEPEVLVTGSDFVAAPRLSPDGTALAWLRWNHPSMPWDSTELVIRDLATGRERVIAGGPDESVLEPRWGVDNTLWFVSDRSNWWNLYRYTPGTDVEAVVRIDAEIGVPPWQFGSARYAMLTDGSVVFARTRQGYDGLARRPPDGTITDLDTPFSRFTTLRVAADDTLLVVAGSPTEEPGVHRLRPDGSLVETLRAPRELGVDARGISVPEHITFPGEGGRTAHALFYPPAHAELTGPDGELPPLIVEIHGGPTGAASPVFSTAVQYWTSRGFAVVDVNYGGSTGYGRVYRKELAGNWGIVDVADCLAAARHLARTGRVDAKRLTIRGGSAGGFTTLAALARDDTPFAAGADHFGVADLEALARDTHKFESRYLDGLVGPLPAARDRYLERSPIHHVDRLTRPLIVLQGSEDAIVPPAQSETIVDALRQRRVPVAYLLFEGEQHGFRRAENIRRALDAELSFYAQMLGFTLPDGEGIEPVPIENL
ncbi:peptidase S9 [Mycobacterium sp. 1164966.3]|uniref:alpha/beta hydrolase family protein n=1 Tax=Mycobacterium sp. 1164966.3 TaxID=1856861 RepID=UPI0008010B37|nr:S9 family peptidase [Mycobacterium sp. 1164966.3]OBA84389.1 peptidase S9 [Mycobacterium sp. 1164966.3]